MLSFGSSTAVALVLVLALLAGACQGRGFYFYRAQQAGASNGTYPVQYFKDQLIDHFNPLDNRTFTQRYWVNQDYYDPKHPGPLILYINGEGPVSNPPHSSDDGVVVLAKAFGAMIVTLEHRYYGWSVPTPDLSTENLQWLSSKQALDDLAMFLTWFKQQQNIVDAPVITWGGSYSGALSAWFRLKYPQLTIGAIASSGVVNAVFNFIEFDEQVSLSAGPNCSSLLRQVTQEIQSMVFGGATQNAAVKAMFQATMLADGDFFFYVADKMAESVQYGFQANLCNPLLALPNPTPAGLLTVFANYCVAFAGPELGLPYTYGEAANLNITVDGEAAWRQWWWQTCSELAYFQNAPPVNSIRSQQVNMTYQQYSCQNLFGVWPPNTNATNNYYGGNHTDSSNIWFNQGSQDPWQRAGVQYTLSYSEPAHYTQCMNCGHCVDIVGCPGGCSDANKALEETRGMQLEVVRQWLKGHASRA